MIVGDLASRFAHHSHIRVVQAPTRADSIEKESDLDACFRPLAKRIPELPSDLVRMQNVGGKVYRLLGRPDRLEHRWKILVAVREQLDLVARDRHWIRKGEGGTEKLRIPHGERMLEVIFERMTPDKEHAENQN